MANRSGGYGWNKRQKELKRKKKQEEKRLRRQKSPGTANIQPESPENAPAVTENTEEMVTTKE